MINRIIVFTKRIFINKVYISLIAFLVALAVTYMFIPEQNKSASINIAICCDDNAYFNELTKSLENAKSIYSFYFVDNKDDVINDVKSSVAECGYYIPDGFFDSYINGNQLVLMEQYVIPSTTLSSAISETLFSQIYEICSDEILYSAYKITGNDSSEIKYMLSENLKKYLKSEAVFSVADSQEKEYIFENAKQIIHLPVFEFGMLFIIFSVLLGILNYKTDKENKVYITFSAFEKSEMLFLNVLTAVLPVYVVSLICLIICNMTGKDIILMSVSAFIFSILMSALSVLFKNKKSMIVFIPLIMLIAVAVLFVRYIAG